MPRCCGSVWWLWRTVTRVFTDKKLNYQKANILVSKSIPSYGELSSSHFNILCATVTSVTVLRAVEGRVDMRAAGGENTDTTKQMTDSTFRKSLYALEQWPSAIEGLQSRNKSKEYIGFFCSLIDRTVSELEVISSLLDRQTKKQEQQNANGCDKVKSSDMEENSGSKSGASQKAPTASVEECPTSEASKRPHSGESPTGAQAPPTVVRKARMKYTPLRKPSV